MGTWGLVAVFVVVALGAIALAVFSFRAAFLGAVALLAFAAEQGFVGFAAYVACWVFLFPFMLVACILLGIGQIMNERDAQEIRDTRKRLGLDP